MAGIEPLIEELERSYADLQARLSDPAVYNDHREAADVGRRLKELETPHKLAVAWQGARADLADAKDDPELASMAADLESDVARLEEELKAALVERDPADSKDVIVEVRQGVGGDEAAIWAGDVYRMLTRYAERRGFKTEILSANESESGGFKEIVFAVKGDGAFSVYKYEGGTHRVQRVPETESQGRIHTSTATVAVMPEAEEVEVEIAESDLKIDVYRSTGPGRPERQHDRLGGAHHPHADRCRRRDAGREVAAAEPPEGDARPPRPALRARAREGAGPALGGAQARRSARASAPRRSAPTTIRRTGSPITGSS